MSDNFLGEIRLFAFSKIPIGWLVCDGRELSISQYNALHSLLHTKFGGDGIRTFKLPDLRGRVAIGAEQGGGGLSSGGGSYVQGASGGAEAVTLSMSQLPAHTHSVQVADHSETPSAKPAANFLSGTNSSAGSFRIYGPRPAPGSANWVALGARTFGSTGNGIAHENRQPVLALQACIAVTGTYPPRHEEWIYPLSP